ncbi:Phage terminase, small subunit [Rhodovulum sp. PH10]|uniref:terminase small subunit-like protein n=1 Tax=Rhodovulum sp. PH10 TaxID=1187851 RepID=UPI00027C292C|nr:hypothetical protein [Rhodovulum sp. PH10]EJW11256.1 Phage terminase, small subunit [Rhodovulum sp. PH10]
MGRPSEFSQDIADAICERLSDGQSLRMICAASDMPSASTVFRWLQQHSDFREQYARAREAQADHMAEEILAIADTPQEGERREESADGYKVIREDMLGHRRLQVDARKWLMARMAPKKYGDKVTSEVTGADGGPVEVVGRIERVIVKPNVPRAEDADG